MILMFAEIVCIRINKNDNNDIKIFVHRMFADDNKNNINKS